MSPNSRNRSLRVLNMCPAPSLSGILTVDSRYSNPKEAASTQSAIWMRLWDTCPVPYVVCTDNGDSSIGVEAV